LARLPKKSFWGILLLVVLLLFTMKLTDINRTNLTPPEVLLRDILAPLQGGVMVVTAKVSDAVSNISNYKETNIKYEELKGQVDNLRSKLSQLEEYRQENVRLRRLLNLQTNLNSDWDSIAASVIARDASNWYHTITLNRGSNDGVGQNMPIINSEGLIGRVIAVTNNTAEVLLLMDPEGAVGGLVQETRTPGIIEGVGQEQQLMLVHLAHNAEVEENQVVITSGLGDIFPKGLRIGYITNIAVEANGLVKKAVVKPFVEFDRLEEVFILTGHKEAK